MLGFDLLNTLFVFLNKTLDFIFLWGGIFFFLVAYPTYFFATNLKKYTKDNRGQELVSQAFLTVVIGTLFSLIWAAADIIWYVWFSAVTPAEAAATWGDRSWLFSSIRFLLLLITLFGAAYIWGGEHGGGRWFASAVSHIAIIVLGWVTYFWMGFLLISVPLIATYYGALYSLANIILPPSNPDDKNEKRKRFFLLASYTWGTQSPMTVADSNSWKKPRARIPGDITWEFSDYPLPFLNKLLRDGAVWTRAHQVVAITGGTNFKRVDGPGLVFTGKLERPEQVFDLRLQLRTRIIEVVSKDGIRFNARYFTAFRMDNQDWTREQYEILRRKNPLLRGADKVTKTDGSFSYSPQRVQAAMGVTSTKVEDGTPLIYWDQWAMNVVEGETRKVIAKKNLDDMWKPPQNTAYANAMDGIAQEIKQNAEITLRASGILLVVARVVDFEIPAQSEEGNQVTQQHLKTWGSEWEKRRKMILADAEAESERLQQLARAQAEAEMLTSIADGLKATQEMNADLPQHVIAMRFLSSLEDLVQGGLPDEGKEANEKADLGQTLDLRKRDRLTRFFQDWQQLFFSNRGKDK